MVQVQDEYGQQNAEIHEDQREQQILAEKWYDQWRRRYQVDQQQIEDEQGDKNGNAQCQLFAAIARQIKNEHRQERDADTRNDQVDCVEEGLPPDCDIEVNVHVLLHTAVIDFDVLLGRNFQNVPLDWLVVVGHVYAELDHIHALAASDWNGILNDPWVIYNYYYLFQIYT